MNVLKVFAWWGTCSCRWLQLQHRQHNKQAAAVDHGRTDMPKERLEYQNSAFTHAWKSALHTASVSVCVFLLKSVAWDPGLVLTLGSGPCAASCCGVFAGIFLQGAAWQKKRLLLACSQHACVFLLIPGTWDPSLTLAMTAAKCRRILVRFPASRRRQFQSGGCARVHFKHSNAYGVAWCARLWSPKLLCLWRLGFPM